MAKPTSFYTRTQDGFAPTANCIGPWDPELQHGGPPAALLAGAAERFGEDASNFAVVRVTVELLRPIGLAPLTVEVSPARLGRQAQWLLAQMHLGGKVVARASVVRVARVSLTLPEREAPRPSPRGPEGLEDFVFPFFRSSRGYHRAVDLRIAEGTWGEGACTAWMRTKVPLVEDEPSTPLEQLLVLADASNGVAPALPTGEFAFINPELTVHLRRPPRGEWFALAARSAVEPIGTGLVEAELFDRDSAIGRCAQSLVVRATPS